MPDALIEEIRLIRIRLGGALGGLMLPMERDREKPIRRETFHKWLAQAEKAAELPKLDGGMWHQPRRAWASSRKHLSLSDAAAVGGWRDVKTLLRSYMVPDEDTILAVMSEQGKRPASS
ncbi:MAG: hypothetical protein H0T48_17680, partial [Gemmatimonadaceae bacterium]|nr:hypothetical protein [Gemmatimonadaceae bacterium]